LRLEAPGVSVELPPGWSGRAVRASEHTASLHAGDFVLADDDGEFGEQSTAAMPAVASFVSLTEYLPGSGHRPARGMFRRRGLRLPLDPTAFSAGGVAVPRPGQVGMRDFFTAADRPFCLYVVLSGPRTVRRRQLLVVDYVLRSLSIE
jgi:hypothetical protein